MRKLKGFLKSKIRIINLKITQIIRSSKAHLKGDNPHKRKDVGYYEEGIQN